MHKYRAIQAKYISIDYYYIIRPEYNEHVAEWLEHWHSKYEAHD